MNTLGLKLSRVRMVFLMALIALGALAQSAQDPSAGGNAQQKAKSGTPDQKPSDPLITDDQALPTIHTRADETNVVFTVMDKKGRHITDLKQNDFRVVDDNKPPDQIRSFQAETNLPLQVGLLIDASNSVRDRFKFEQESAVEFLNQTIHPQKDQAFVVGFDVTPEVTQDFKIGRAHV